MKYLFVLIPWIKAWDIHFVWIIIKLRQSITDWNLHKTNMILCRRQPYYELFYSLWFWISQTHIAYKLPYIIARRRWSYLFSLSFQLIFLHCMMNILRHEKNSGRFDESIIPFITQSINWYDLTGRICFSLSWL